MLTAMKFVRGAVARKDFVPALTHFNISNRTIRGFNGTVALCSPIPLDLSVTPKADTFIKAIESCRGATQLSLAEGGKLLVKSGSFRVFVDCLESEAFPAVYPEGVRVELGGGLVAALRALAPFIADDASRKWATGILFRGASSFATNNVVLLEYWLGYNFPGELSISKHAVNELLRIDEEPTHLQVAEASVTFHYEGGRWLRAQNSPVTWPPLEGILNRESNLKPLTDEFFQALESLAPFVDESEQVFVAPGKVSTSQQEGIGATVDVPDLVDSGVFNVRQLLHLKGLAEEADLSMYPTPALFYGGRVRGAIVGIKV